MTDNITNLANKARLARLRIIETIAASGKGHIGGALSCIDVLVTLYYGDILKLSNGSPRFLKDYSI